MNRRGHTGIAMLAIALVIVATVPGVILGAGVPTDLSPVGVSAAQSANQTSNQTANLSGNRSANRSAAVVVFDNQTTNGTNATISSVTLPSSGFVVLDSSGFDEPGLLEEDAIAVSQQLSAGIHRNVTLNVSHSPPGGVANQTVLNASGGYEAVLYNDSNDNGRFEYITSGRNADQPVTIGSGAKERLATDSARITVPGTDQSPSQPARISFPSQQANGTAVTIASARLPEGGFIVIHNESYLPPENTPLDSAVGVTSYLESGQHSNVSVPLIEGALKTDQTLVAVPYRDTNSNQRYDYVTSDGFRDTAYVNRTGNQSVITNDTASVTVNETEETLESRETTTPIDTTTPFRIETVSLSNRSVRVGDEVSVRVWITNPGETRLEGELALATAGKVAETHQIALFPRESRSVTFTHSYDASGKYVVKVGNHTEQVRVVEEGAPLTPLTTTATTGPNATGPGVNGSDTQTADAQSQSGSLSLTDIILLVVLLIVLGGLIWVIVRLRKRI